MASDSDLSVSLNTLYSISKENSTDQHLGETFGQFCQKVNEIIPDVFKKDPRFRCPFEDVGGLFADVTSGRFNEKDTILLLEIAGDFQELDPGFARFRLSPRSADQWEDCSVRAEKGVYLHSGQLQRTFKKHVQDVIKEKGYQIKVTGEGVATTLSETVSGLYPQGVSVSADLVVAVQCRGWPRYANAPWLSGQQAWPRAKDTAEIKRAGFQLVGKSNRDQYSHPDPLLWRVSFATSEMILLREIDLGNRREVLCHKKCLIIFKMLRKFLCEGNDEFMTPAITSYHMKITLFHESEKFPNPADWREEKLVERYRSFVERLTTCGKDGRINSFFMPNVNLLENIPGSTLLQLAQHLRGNCLPTIKKAVQFSKSLKPSTFYAPERR